MLTLNEALVYTVFISGVTFFTRVFPFVVFKVKKPSETVILLEKYIPPAIMMLLLFYCLKNVNFIVNPHGIPEIVGVLTASIVQYKFKNPLYSIFGATIFYMILIRLL